MKALGKRQGAVLIVVLGVLCILALLATTFATMQMTERQIARNYLDTVRAKLLAQSGVEDATTRLKDYFPLRAFNLANPNAPKPWKYWSDDLTETVEPATVVPLNKAQNPSFAYEDETIQDPTDANVKPKLLTIEGQPRGFSGVMESGSYGLFTEHYALKVSDLAGHIYVNDGLEGGAAGGVSQNLKRILNVLGTLPSVGVPTLGTDVLAKRPAPGYHHINELLAVVGYNEAVFKKIKEFLTVDAWVDRNVANPVPLSQALVNQEPELQKYAQNRGGLFRFGSSKDATGPAGKEIVPATGLNTCPPIVPNVDPAQMDSACVYGVDTLNPQWIEIVSRAPVNVNSAPREVLIALLSDLRGFFLTDRRRDNPRWSGMMYNAVVPRESSYSPSGTVIPVNGPLRPEGDEYGYLVQTKPILAPPPGTRTAGEIYADTIADHLIACRGRKAFGGFDYGTVSWGGPFRTWHQFNQFADNLIAVGVLQDNRPLFFDYPNNGAVDEAGYGTPAVVMVASPLNPPGLQRKHAMQAIADVLKANFNPNLHLNELNPDANLHTIVDKTDLIINSTEFTFLPTGYFEIESLGRVVRPKAPGAAPDARTGDNEMIAQAKVTAVIKLYDLYRETQQKQFYGGTMSPQSASFGTNNNRSVEIGPEPDNGVFPGTLAAAGDPDNEWDGYIALPTIGGDFGGSHGAPDKTGTNTLVNTLGLAKTNYLNSAFHVHFTLDFDAHYHVLNSISGADARQELSSRTLPLEKMMNFPDATAAYSGPYAPTSGTGNVHRLAKSFRLKAGSTTPSLTPFAPSDLHIDGGYSERHSAPSYYTSTSAGKIWDFDKEQAQGMVSFWMKPSFDPERTGKIRSWFDLSRHHGPLCGNEVYIAPFPLWFFPTYHDAQEAETYDPQYGITVTESFGHVRPASLAWGSYEWHPGYDLDGHGFGRLTSSLNHVGHLDETSSLSPLRGHRWINLTYSWYVLTNNWSSPPKNSQDTDGTKSCHLYINGSESPALVPYTYTSMTGFYSGSPSNKMWYFDMHENGDENHMRLGAPSQISSLMGAPYRSNYTADATFDEFYVWRKSPKLINLYTLADPALNPLTPWQQGRYYKPASSSEGIFTSRAFQLNPDNSSARLLAPASNVAPPGPPLPPSPTQTAPLPTLRVLGIAWTWHGEPLDPAVTPLAGWDGKQVLYDYSNWTVAPVNVKPRVTLGIKDGAVTVMSGPNDDEGFFPTRSSGGATLVIQDPTQVRYVAQFSLPGANAGTVLLATPVLDDVTIYWDDTHTYLISYVFDNRSIS